MAKFESFLTGENPDGKTVYVDGTEMKIHRNQKEENK